MNKDDAELYIFDGYKLYLNWTGKTESGNFGKYQMEYEFYNPAGELLFSGDDYYPSPMNSIDGIDSAAGLLGFLTLKPGDTDNEYFDKYTEKQLEFAHSNDCEYLGIFALDGEKLEVEPDGRVILIESAE